MNAWIPAKILIRLVFEIITMQQTRDQIEIGAGAES